MTSEDDALNVVHRLLANNVSCEDQQTGSEGAMKKQHSLYHLLARLMTSCSGWAHEHAQPLLLRLLLAVRLLFLVLWPRAGSCCIHELFQTSSRHIWASTSTEQPCRAL